MEIFISDLTMRKVKEFNQLRSESIRWTQTQVEISEQQHDLIDAIYECLDSRDEEALGSVINKWLVEKPATQLPRSTFCEVVEFSSSMGNTELFHKLISYTKTFEPEFHEENLSYFETLNLELDWRTCGNVDRLIENFESLYKKSLSDEVTTRHMTKFCSVMIQDCVNKKGEAVVLKLKDKIEKICDESKDYQLLFELWRNLFER